jgi:signal transduction histidine kinase
MRFFIFIFSIFILNNLWSQTINVRKVGANVGIASNFVYDIAQDQDDAILIATDNGLYRFNGSFAKIILPNVFIRKVKVYKNQIFALSNDGVIYCLENLRVISKYQFKIDNINDIALVENNLWITNGSQLFLAKNKKDPKEIQHIYGYLEGFFSTNTQTFAYSKQEAVRLTSKGLEFTKNYKNIRTVADANGPSTSVFTQQNVDQLGGVNATTIQGLHIDSFSQFLIVDGKCILKSAKTQYDLKNNELQNLAPNRIFVDKEGGVWLIERGKETLYLPFPKVLNIEGKTTNQVWKLETLQYYLGSNFNTAATGEIQEYDLQKDATWIIAQKGVFCLKSNVLQKVSDQTGSQIAYNSTDKTIFIATLSDGIVCINEKGEELKKYNISNGLSHHIIHDLKMVERQLYVLTEAGGIDIIANGIVADHPNNAEFKKGIFTSIVYNVQGNTIAIASPNLGVYSNYNNSKDWTYIPFTHLIYSIFQRQNQLWILHDKGVDVFSNNQLQSYYRPTEAANSFPISRFIYQNASQIKLHLQNGSLEFVQPTLYQKPEEGSILNLRINDKMVGGNTHFLPYGKYRIRFEFDQVDLKSNDVKPVYYRVEGYDTRWKLITSNTVELININNGNYTIEFKSEGVLLKQKLNFEIDAPLWQKWWFWLITIIVLGTAVYFIIEWRIRHLRIEKIQLEKIIRARTRELKQKNEELEQYAFSVSHDFKNPVVNISQLTAMVRSGSLPESDANEALNHIQTTADQLHTNLLGMLELLQINGTALKIERIFVPDLLKSIQASLKSQIEAEGGKIEMQDMARFVDSNGSYLYSIFYNLISNSIKYRSHLPPVIQLIGTDTEKGFQIEVKDNGLGLKDDAQLKQLFQPFVRIHTQGEGTGIGLSLVQKMARSLNIKLTAQRNADQGLCFVLVFEK